LAKDFDQAQFEVLVAFYEAWEALHSIPAGELYRKKKEAAAELMVGHAHTLRRMFDEKPRVLVPSFTRH
jgi:hypothetical protein